MRWKTWEDMGYNIFFFEYEYFPVLPLWLFLIIIYIAHSYDSDENERELYDNKCKECIWMHNSQGEILAFLFGGYMCATLSVRVGEILGGWRKHVVCDFLVWESAFIWWVQVNSDLRGMKHLSTAVQKFDQTQHRASSICRRFNHEQIFGHGRNKAWSFKKLAIEFCFL